MAKPPWQNRIVAEGEQAACQFLAHAYNFRRHPNAQREVMRGILGEVGWVQRVLVNKRTGNTLDGHLRIEEALSRDENEPVPFTLIDVSEEEENLILATLDPLAAMSVHDGKALDLLMRDIQAEDGRIHLLLDQLNAEAEQLVIAEGAISTDRYSSLDAKKTSRPPVVKVVLAVSDLKTIETALRCTGIQERGAAFLEICQSYLNEKGQFDVQTEGGFTN